MITALILITAPQGQTSYSPGHHPGALGDTMTGTPPRRGVTLLAQGTALGNDDVVLICAPQGQYPFNPGYTLGNESHSPLRPVGAKPF